MSTDRIQRLLARLAQPLPREMCFERARLMTRSYRQTEGEPAIVRRAKAFYAILDGLPICIDDGELIVGNVASKPRVAYFAPETFNWGACRAEGKQTRVDGRLSRDLAIEYEIPREVADYWRDKPTGGTAGHFVADYELILKMGFSGLREEIARHPRTAFYEAAEIACEAAIRFAQRHAAKAAEAFERAIREDPTYAVAHYNFGSLLLDEGKTEDAARHLRAATQIVPSYAEAWQNLGTAYATLKQYDKASACCERAVRLKPSLWQAHLLLALMDYRKGKTPAAIERLKRAIRLRPDVPQLRAELRQMSPKSP